MRRLVVDASVGAKWFVIENDSDAADKLLEYDVELCAPDFIAVEFGSVLTKRMRRQLVDSEIAAGNMNAFRGIGLRLYQTGPLAQSAFDLALTIGNSIYDDLYLALALKLNCKVVTADRKFYNAVANSPFAKHMRWFADAV